MIAKKTDKSLQVEKGKIGLSMKNRLQITKIQLPEEKWDEFYVYGKVMQIIVLVLLFKHDMIL